MSAIHANASAISDSYSAAVNRRKKTEDEYFEEDEEEPLPYKPAPGSPSARRGGGGGSDSEEDALDAFMAGIDQEVKYQASKPTERPVDAKGVRDDIEQEDDEETYYRLAREIMISVHIICWPFYLLDK